MSQNPPSDSDTEDTQNSSRPPSYTSSAWIDAMQDLFDTAVDRQAEIECELDDVEVEVPLEGGPDPNYAEWTINGTLQFRFDGIGDPLAE
jgi:hypothetical protein